MGQKKSLFTIYTESLADYVRESVGFHCFILARNLIVHIGTLLLAWRCSSLYMRTLTVFTKYLPSMLVIFNLVWVVMCWRSIHQTAGFVNYSTISSLNENSAYRVLLGIYD